MEPYLGNMEHMRNPIVFTLNIKRRLSKTELYLYPKIIYSRLNYQITLFVHDSGTVFEKYTEQNQDLNIILDLNTQSIASLESYFKKRKRTDGANWLVNTPVSTNLSLNKFTENIKKPFNNLTLDLDDDVYFYQTNTDQTVDISEGYKISEEFEILVRKIGSWSQSHGLKISEPNKAWRRKDMQGKNFIVTTMNDGYSMVIVNETLFGGFYGNILESMKVSIRTQQDTKYFLNIQSYGFKK